ncbi:MAG: single-stranded DNA-binding protein [Gammaproteobacteria bacterium]
MSQSFAELKRSTTTSLDALLKETNKLTNNEGNKGGADTRFWQPEVDKSGAGQAIIRFLPAPKGEDIPWVRIFNHGFQGPGGWYIENSLTTLNKKDPVSEYNSMLWNRGDDAGKEQARKQKRRLLYISNVYVIQDKAHPENEGQVRLFRYGKKIFDKLNEAMNPEFEDEKPLNPFDLWEGASFILKIRNVDGYRNYDKSVFGEAGPLLADDSKLEGIWNSEYKLQEFSDPSKFKTYDELKEKLDKVLALSGGSQPSSTAETTQLDTAPAPSVGKVDKPKSSESDTDLDFFQKLAEDD